MIYDRIKELCKENGISVNELEKNLGIARGSLFKIDKHKPSSEKIQKLSKALNTTPEYLLYGDVHQNEHGNGYYINEETAKVAQEIFESKELRVLFDAARDASPEDLQTAYNVLLALKRKEQYTNEDDSGC